LIVLVLANLFLTGKFNLFNIILRSLGFSFILYILSSIYRNTKYKLPWKWIIIAFLVIVFAHIYSARDFSSFKLIDKLIGIENFTNSLISLYINFTRSSAIDFNPITSRLNITTNFTTGTTTTHNLITSELNTRDIEKAIFIYTNIERKKHGLKELIWDEKLAEIAREHSIDMAQNKFFSHINLKGEDPTARAIRHDYNVYKSLGGGWFAKGIAENIGKMPTGYVSGIGYVNNDVDSIAQAQVKAWMNSQGHRENILNPNYDKIGVGVAYDGIYYISTQNFW
ncbi:MAG: CAP domain-containing protein, partial [Candidatus Aenigmatarchaeota archaeon]